MFNFSSIFGGNNSFSLSDYKMIQSGSYRKLMKSYYAEQKEASGSKSSKSSKSSSGRSILEKLAEEKRAQLTKDTQINKDSTGLSKMNSQAGSLKSAAEALYKSDLFGKSGESYDASAVAKKVSDFVNQYNSTLDQSGKVVSKDVAQQITYMKRMTSAMSKDLEKVGVTVGTDGKLSVKEDTLKSAAAKDVKALFSGSHSYAADIADKAGAIGSAAIRSASVYSADGTLSSSVSGTFSNWI